MNTTDMPLMLDEDPAPGNTAPVPMVASTPIPAAPTSAKPKQQAAGIFDFHRAEMAAARFRVLHRLMVEGQIPPSEYDLWADQNIGAFLLLTAPPPLISVSYKAPSYEDLSQFLQSAQADKNAKAGAAAREALLRALMPKGGARAEAASPPADLDALQRWIAFLDQLGTEGLVPVAWIETEETAINDARLAAGLPAASSRP
jgi:hypothetical protein